MATNKTFFADFPPISTAEWKAKIVSDLKGVPYDKKLVWHTSEGFEVEPFYRREDLAALPHIQATPGTFPYVRSTRQNNTWQIRQDIAAATAEEVNQKALDVLLKGVNALGLSIPTPWLKEGIFDILLEGITLKAIEIHFSCCVTQVPRLLLLLESYCRRCDIDTADVRGTLDFNPFKRELVRGKVAEDWQKDCAAVLKAAKPFPHLRCIEVAGHLCSDAGAYITQELGYALACGAEILDAMIAKGYTLEEVSQHIGFRFGVGSNYFMEIAKFRAARMLWAQIVAAHGEEYRGAPAKIYQQAVTSRWNMTLYDAHVNLLRTQTAAMSAALGGVDTLSVLPFDSVYSAPNDFSLRMARNQQLLLQEESHFDKVVDPGGGAYYIEVLTDQIAKHAWALFLRIDEIGGFAHAVQHGEVQREINTSNRKRHDAVAKRREQLLGTNQFPNFRETALEKLDEGNRKASLGCQVDHSCEGNVESLDFRRGASDFEVLRLATERHSKQPVVFMLTIGNLGMRLARSQFSGNFFATAGYKLIDNLGFETVQEGVNAAIKQEADIVVLCSSDEEYADFAPEAYHFLKDRLPLVVAGNPPCKAELEKLGIRHFIHIKSDVLATLQEFNRQFGITTR